MDGFNGTSCGIVRTDLGMTDRRQTPYIGGWACLLGTFTIGINFRSLLYEFLFNLPSYSKVQWVAREVVSIKNLTLVPQESASGPYKMCVFLYQTLVYPGSPHPVRSIKFSNSQIDYAEQLS
jgi:hypothetical protein